MFKIWPSGDHSHSDHDSWPRQCAPLEDHGDMAPLLSTLMAGVGQRAPMDLVLVRTGDLFPQLCHRIQDLLLLEGPG